MGYRNQQLDEAMRGEGRGIVRDDAVCHGCYLEDATVRCDDCFGWEMFCRACCVKRHACSPLHRIKVRALLSLNFPHD